MKLIVSSDVAKLYPNLRIGVVVARGINNYGRHDKLEALKREKVATLRQVYSLDTLSTHPYIIAWRDTYQSFGVNPKKSQPTAEALIRRVLKGLELPNISKAVDLYLLAEIEFFLPIGGYDLDRIAGDIVLRLSPGNESFVPLGSSQATEITKPGEVIYADSERVLTRAWNFRDCDFCKITEESTNIALFSEAALPSIPTSDLEKLIEKIQEYILIFCGGQTKTLLVNVADHLEWELS